MTVRTRLTLQFLLLAALVLGFAFLILHRSEFKERLHKRGLFIAGSMVQPTGKAVGPFHVLERHIAVRIPEENIRIFDQHDSLIHQTAGGGTIPPFDAALRDRIRAQGSMSMTDGLTEMEAFSVRIDGQDLLVSVSGRDVYGRRKVEYQLKVMLIIFLVGLVLLFFVGRAFAKRALTPLNTLVSGIREIEATDLTRRLAVRNKHDELGDLATAFNGSLDRLERAFNAQRDFIANASHELRTPLTVITGQLDVLLLKDRDPAEYQRTITSILEDVQGLSRLCDQLLLLAQMDSPIANIPFGPVRLDELLWTVRSGSIRAEPAYRIHVTMQEVEDGSDLTVHGNVTLLRSALMNLVENGCKYAPDGAVFVHLNGTGPRVILSLTSRGARIPEEDRERIFLPFHRSRNSKGRPGHGIGLALALRVVEAHGGEIQMDASAEEGTVFTVLLNKAEAPRA